MATAGSNLKLIHVKSACEACRVRELCLPTSLNDQDVSLIDDLVIRRAPLNKGDFLYRTGDKFRGIYALQYGAIKTYGVTRQGREQVTGFHLAGEVLGLDAIDEEIHPCNAVALEKTEVCQIPFHKLEQLSTTIPGLLHNLSKVMSREIKHEEHVLMMLGGTTAEQRIVRFILNLKQRMSKSEVMGYSFKLCMSRQDISNYLGLALETVSRQLTNLQDRDVLEIHNRYITILNPEELQKLAD
ncbi:MAG: fumarate/nitrate reduction transcriptional regulator Fnr [Gammaproteobacteria bacterium]|nr:fumarate/nitrate reduction transcriptional regulator Fnr [Gammaproteobacteria bacterium]